MPSVAPVVLVDAVRSPIGRRGGGLSTIHPNELLGAVLASLIERTGIDPEAVDQVVGGCVGQVGAQASNVTRQAWLTAGLPLGVAASTSNVQCGSSQQASTLAHGLVASELCDVVVACGVEVMSLIPLGANIPADGTLGAPRAGRYVEHYEPTTQFDGADRIATQWDLSRSDLDNFGLRSHALAATAWSEGRFDGQVVPIDVNGARLVHDEGIRDTSIEKLGALRTNREAADASHTAGTTSQVSDGAAAMLLMREDTAEQLGLEARARIIDSVLVGSDPVLMLTGPMPATRKLLERNSIGIDDIDLFEVNEAFASVVLAWQKELRVDASRVNPNGGAIALGHPLGATGVALITKAVHELDRARAHRALISMCCGGGLGTGTLIERL